MHDRAKGFAAYFALLSEARRKRLVYLHPVRNCDEEVLFRMFRVIVSVGATRETCFLFYF